MVTDQAAAPAAAAPANATRISVIGELERGAAIAIVAAGMTIIHADGDNAEAAAADTAKIDARVVLGSSLETIAHACAHGQPVVADSRPDDFRRISALLRLGVAEVVLTPIVPSGLVRKLARAIRKRVEVP
jgi:hypothetical protein